MSIAVEGYGSFIEAGTDGVTYNRIAEVTRIGGPTAKTTIIDVSNLDSPSNRKEFLGGMVDEGQVKLELNFTDAEYLNLRSLLVTVTPTPGTAVSVVANAPWFRITLSTGNVITGQGWIEELDVDTPVDDKISANATIKCTGLWSVL